jgi:AraC-like DNA-binding protein
MRHLYRYLPLSDDVRARCLYVLAGGSAHIPPGTHYPPSTHPQHHQFHWHHGRILQEYQMIYITQGSGVLESQIGGQHRIKTGDLFCLFPGEWHRYSPDQTTGWEEHWVAFQGKRAAEMMEEHSVSAHDPLFHTDTNDLILREFGRIEEEMADELVDYQSVVVARVQLILALSVASHRRRSIQSTDALEIIKRAKSLMLEQIDRPIALEELAAELQVGYSWLRKTFRQYTGLPLAKYQIQMRLNHACELLKNTTLPIAAIGSRSGFESAYYFTRVFRDKVGCTPSEYRLKSRFVLTADDKNGPYSQ